MSRARKGLRAPTKKHHRAKVNPNRRQGPRISIEAMLESKFGPLDGEIVEIGMSDGLLYWITEEPAAPSVAAGTN